MSTKTEELLTRILAENGPLAYAPLASKYESAMRATAVAALVVRPTTLAAITFWNGEGRGGKSLVMDRLFGFCLVSTAAAAKSSLWYCVHLEMTKPTNDITTLRGTGDGREPDNSMVVVDEGATVLDNGWFPCGPFDEVEPTGVLPGGTMEWECKGRLVIPPKCGISLQVVSATVGNTYQTGASWHRVQL